MKPKLMLLFLAILICATFTIPALKVQAATTITSNQTGTIDDYNYELRKDTGTASMTLNGAGNFTCAWSNVNNALFRIGKKFDGTKTYQELGDISLTYGCIYQPNGASYLCVYGWTRSPLVEYYIVESWGSWRPVGGVLKGILNVDGGTYEIYQTMRVNQPSIEGIATFPQFWSVRTSKRTSGTVSVTKHFNAWANKGMTLGKICDCSLTVESYQCSGTANVYCNILTIGGNSTPTPTKSITVTPDSSPSPTPTPSQIPTGCSIGYSQRDWGSGASVSITVTNNSSTAIDGWSLAWNFAGNQKITNLWNGTYTQNSTAVKVKNTSFNSTIPAKGSVTFGFNLSYSGSNTTPTGFVLNGQTCQIQ